MTPELNPPPATLVAIQLFKRLTVWHIYIYMSFGGLGLRLESYTVWLMQAYIIRHKYMYNYWSPWAQWPPWELYYIQTQHLPEIYSSFFLAVQLALLHKGNTKKWPPSAKQDSHMLVIFWHTTVLVFRDKCSLDTVFQCLQKMWIIHINSLYLSVSDTNNNKDVLSYLVI